MSKRIATPCCGCFCAGSVEFGDGKLPLGVKTCRLGVDWFQQRIENANAQFGKVELGDFEPLINQVVEQLSKAKFPLITGIENLTTQAQQASVKTADRFNAGIDSGLADAGRGSMLSFQRYGKVTATLGEIKTRSDLVVFWFCDPQHTHPCFIEKFLTGENAAPKRLVVVDQNLTATAKIADEFIQVSAAEALEYSRRLRLAITDGERTNEDANKVGLAGALTAARYGTVFVGKPSRVEPDFDVVTDQWFQLVRSLNDHTRFVMGALPSHRNRVGANNVLTSLCGFPDAVRFTDTGPIYSGLEYSTASVLRRHECDMLLVCDVGVDEPFNTGMDAGLLDWLLKIPVVVLSDLPRSKYHSEFLHVPTRTPGWTESGDFVRCDDVPIPMDAIATTGAISAVEFFDAVCSASIHVQ